VLSGIRGHVMDLCFSPFHENLLATASAGSTAGDATIKLWVIPEDGLKA